ncbi:MAG TPA: radical SAM protein, partial [bacterium]|nr:radical SAM protein [bacterium]
EWVRLHYLYPSRVSDEMLKVMAENPRIAPYFDVPLQHASDRVLKAMRRIGDRASLEKLVERIRKSSPRASLRSTFIVGFPGETDEDFDQLLDFLRQTQMDYVGFFAYSQEEDTPAGTMEGQVEEKVKQERLARAYRLQEEIAEKSHRRWVGERLRAVVETLDGKGQASGRTKYQAPEVDGLVLIEGLAKPRVGQWVDLEITHTLNLDLVGRVL